MSVEDRFEYEQTERRIERFFFLNAYDEDSNYTLANELASVKVEDFGAWQLNLIQRFNDACQGPLHSYVSKVRDEAGYYGWESPVDDPIQEEPVASYVKEIRALLNGAIEELLSHTACYKKSEEYREWQRKEQEKRDLLVTIEGRQHTALKRFNVLHHGWECDSYGWLVEVDGVKKVVLTNHGVPYWATRDELFDLTESYIHVLNETYGVIQQLKDAK